MQWQLPRLTNDCTVWPCDRPNNDSFLTVVADEILFFSRFIIYGYEDTGTPNIV